MTSISRRLRLAVSTAVILACGAALLGGGGRSLAATGTTSVTVQTMDSCKQGIDGAAYTLTGGSLTSPLIASSSGTGRGTVATGTCPLQHGNCSTFSIGCVTFTGVPVPGVYRMHASTTPPGNTSNPEGYAPCNGGSACRKEEATITVAADGSVTASTLNVYPDGTSVTYPSTGSYAATATDPLVFHLFGLAAPGTANNTSCDGDADADDHLTGTPSSHCAYPEAQETSACMPYPWSCAFTDTGSGGGSSTTTTTSSITTTSSSTTSGTTTTSTTSSAGSPGGAVPFTCDSRATITWPWRVGSSDQRSKHVRTVLAGPVSATLTASGASSMSINIQDASGHTMTSASGSSGSITVSVGALPANSSIYVNEAVTFPTSGKNSYSLAVTHC
ncbi:MAG TPA: hypothetical protein VH134_18140 [Candidatus Dormibacteraeota bacterium]|jgi:hypothetical protein|nr:hypothetical protein [Candidatus Dormibacteraeota bacterium]